MSPGSASNAPSDGTIREEHCPRCEQLTEQRVTIEIREGTSARAARHDTTKYSRGPFRIMECLRCRAATATRIDNR